MIYPVPKPAKRGPKERAPRKQKTRMKQRNARRKGSSFPKQRDRDFCRWLVTENPCLIMGTIRGPQFPVAASAPYQLVYRDGDYRWIHRCWGKLDPAHVGKHRAQGAPDFGATVPLCRAAHAFYDEHRDQWPRATGYSERKMALAASGYALKYVERGGAAPSPDPLKNGEPT